MTASIFDAAGEDDDFVRTRLISAAEQEFAENAGGTVQMEAIAKRAGVSRATAFRRLGSISEVVVQVAMRRARRHIDAVQEVMAAESAVFAKIEAALIYTARELPTDASIAALIAQHSTAANDPRVHQAAVGAMGDVIREGQRRSEIRDDVELDDLIDFLVEQTYLAAEAIDRSETAVRKRFRQFVVPAIEARGGSGGEAIAQARELEAAAAAALAAAQRLTEQLEKGTSSDR
ncbi:regulatory protein, tetR family [Mycolicibacterium rutilum]|uniref:Regulatory protein, tetR family n=1 Tax=Mycolicibacterium rutilum TaxID=370526 RepID=A0A1H6KFR4_MYCRU|nr:TetR/AcrR family transcriptional regulator [Mycolicibacterium rutilum]SEH74336.1 regulatory protein, tetR family [Mycolicibacterium rutilum]